MLGGPLRPLLGQQRLEWAAREPAGGRPVRRRAQGAQGEAREQHEAPALCSTARAVLDEVADVAARLLLQGQSRAASRGAAPHVLDLGGRVVPGLRAEAARAAEQIDLLGVEEERLVEAAEPLE